MPALPTLLSGSVLTENICFSAFDIFIFLLRELSISFTFDITRNDIIAGNGSGGFRIVTKLIVINGDFFCFCTVLYQYFGLV